MRNTLFCAAAVWLAGSAVAVNAATQAYWRHEEGPDGGLIPAGADTVLDSSGNGNHMRTFNPTFTSATYTSQVSPVPLRSGLPNNFSLDFGPGGDDGGNNDDNYTDNKPINAALFSAVTFELAFKMDAVSGYQALFGEDGKPLGNEPGETDSPVPPLKIMVRGDDFPGGVPSQLFVEWIDGDGDIHNVANGQTVDTSGWYHVAFTLNATDAALWVARESGPYSQVASLTGQDFAGASGEVIVAEPLGYSVGRGMFGNNVTDWSDAKIDEVRVTDAVLSMNEFLFAAGPEPGALVLAVAAFGLCGLARNRR
ncbi:MAG: hypothetical protein IT424_07240 [Pirellulales bacterium]|nr:hypothetical protein [Pirellulales bacterium]